MAKFWNIPKQDKNLNAWASIVCRIDELERSNIIIWQDSKVRKKSRDENRIPALWMLVQIAVSCAKSSDLAYAQVQIEQIMLRLRWWRCSVCSTGLRLWRTIAKLRKSKYQMQSWIRLLQEVQRTPRWRRIQWYLVRIRHWRSWWLNSWWITSCPDDCR